MEASAEYTEDLQANEEEELPHTARQRRPTEKTQVFKEEEAKRK